MLRPFDNPSQQCCDNISFVFEMLRGCCRRLTGHGHNMSQHMLKPFDQALKQPEEVVEIQAICLSAHVQNMQLHFVGYSSVTRVLLHGNSLFNFEQLLQPEPLQRKRTNHITE